MTSEMDAAALGAVDDMVEIVSPRPTWQPPRRVWTSLDGGVELWPEGNRLRMHHGCNNEMVPLSPADVRDLILALQQWLAPKEGLG